MSEAYGWEIVLAIAGIIGVLKFIQPFIQSVTTKYGDFSGLAIFIIVIYLLFAKKYRV